jgi:trimeric autotransporter adhesin
MLITALAVGVVEPLTSQAAGAAELVAITVSPATASVAAGDTQQFTATGHYLTGPTQNLTDSVTWSSSSSSATISNASGSQGLVTGVSTGAVTITASDPSATLSGTAALVVTPAVLVAVTVSPTTASVAAGDTQQFTATGVYSDTSMVNLTDSVTWSSSSSSATISNASGSQGLATGVSTGAVTITASDPSATLSGTAALVVTPALLGPSVTTTPSSGPRRTLVLLQGTNFVPDQSVTVTYLSKKLSTVVCEATVALNGTFSCSGKIPNGRHGGARGVHTIEATSSSGAGAQTSFTVTKKPRK